MNYWINDFRAELLETLKDWDFLLINDSEARLLSGEHNLRRAAAKIMQMGPRILVIKRGEYGAILFRDGYHFMAPGYLLEDVFDPTGAGDCFAGGFIGYLAGQGIRSVERRCRHGTVEPRGDLRLGDGQLLLRKIRRRPLPHSHPRRNRRPLPGVQNLHRVLAAPAIVPARTSPCKLADRDGMRLFSPRYHMTNDRHIAPVLVAALILSLVSAGAVWFFYAHHYLLYYGDAEAHLNTARRIVDSQTPGYLQFGSPWLPLPHALMLPFVRQ